MIIIILCYSYLYEIEDCEGLRNDGHHPSVNSSCQPSSPASLKQNMPFINRK